MRPELERDAATIEAALDGDEQAQNDPRMGGGEMRFLYFYLMRDAPDRVRGVAPEHAAYWRALGLRGYLGGPFADRSGGLITFEIASAEEAERLVADDPFVREDLLERRWVREWSID